MRRRLREPVSGLTHLVGGLLAVVALIVLLTKAAGRVDQLLAFGIFGLSLVAVVRGERPLPSSACLSARDSEAEEVGSHDDLHPYSGHLHPYLRAGVGWSLAGRIARSDLDVGVVLKLLWMDVPRWLSVGIYLAMGWLAVIAASAIFRAIPSGGIAWILGGGLVYSAGALIYGLKRPNLVPGIFGFHELRHLFVMAGSACHFWVMIRYIAPIS
jgi:hemolysin III